MQAFFFLKKMHFKMPAILSGLHVLIEDGSEVLPRI